MKILGFHVTRATERPTNIPAVAVSRRSYSGALTKARFADFSASTRSADAELVPALNILRSRSRNLARNNPHMVRYLQLMQDNVVGAAGFKLQMNAKNPDGMQDKFANDEISAAWKLWSRTATADGMMSMKEACKLAVRTYCRDGEVLIEKVFGRNFNDGFALHFIEADQLDETLNQKFTSTGNEIRMGVEVNQHGAPVAYHILTSHPGDDVWGIGNGRKWRRVPANRIIHTYVKSRVGQSRGEPPMSSIMGDTKMLGGYREAEVTGRRISAASGGFFETEDSANSLSPIADSEDADSGGLQMNVEPGTFRSLPTGMKFKQFDASAHHTDYAQFEKQIIRSISAGLGPSYVAMAQDLEGVSYSSIRQGALDERDFYSGVQSFFVERFVLLVFAEWLRFALDFGDLRLPARKFDKFFTGSAFRGRGWQWVDPQKEINAAVTAVENNMSSLTQVAATQGKDVEETLIERKAEQELIASIDLVADKPKNGE